MTITPDLSRLGRVERLVHPKLAHAVQIPLSLNHRAPEVDGLTVYVGVHAEHPAAHVPNMDRLVLIVAQAVAAAMQTVPPTGGA